MTPEVQIRIIELAWKLADSWMSQAGTAEKYIEEKTKLFEQAYKAMFKTVGETKLPVKSPTVKTY